MTVVDRGETELLGALRQASGDVELSFEAGPQPLNAKGTVQFIRPGSSERRLATSSVVRICDGPAQATREAVIEDHLNRSGFPTPPVLLTGSVDDPLGGAWLLTELVSGEAVRIGTGRRPLQAVRSLNALWQRPALLADLLIRLHAVDPGPVRRGLAETGSEFDWRRFMWERATAVQGPDAAEVVAWLEGNEPEPSEPVISHGDLHPANIVIGPDGPQVIDWGTGGVAPAARDVACTMFALMTTGSQAPGAAAGPFAMLGRRLSNRFLRLYQTSAPAALPRAELDWHQVLYSMNRLFWASRIDPRATAANSSDPLMQRAARAEGVLQRELPLVARIIHEITGIDLPSVRARY